MLKVYNVVECIVPIYSSTEGLIEYCFEAVAFRGKQTLSVQAYGTTPVGCIPLFDPSTTTKRLSTEILQENGQAKFHGYEHTLDYKSKRSLKTQGTMFSTTNFKQYKKGEEEVVVPKGGLDNWSKFGYTLGVMVANLVRCAKYGDDLLMPPLHLQFKVITDTKEKTRKTRQHSQKGKRRREDSRTEGVNEMKDELNKLQSALEEEKQCMGELSDKLNLAQINLEYHKLIEADFKQEIERRSSEKEKAILQYNNLNTAKDEEIGKLESCITSLTMQLKEMIEKKSKRPKSTREIAKKCQSGPDVTWVEEWGALILAV